MAKRPRAKKAKYKMLYSPSLMRETKHELIGEPMSSSEGRPQQWARCTVTRHSQLVFLDIEENKIEISSDSIKREDCKVYSPLDEYQINDPIFHTKFDDVGVVIRKEVTTNGGQAIIVAFNKLNEKRLVEKYK